MLKDLLKTIAGFVFLILISITLLIIIGGIATNYFSVKSQDPNQPIMTYGMFELGALALLIASFFYYGLNKRSDNEAKITSILYGLFLPPTHLFVTLIYFYFWLGNNIGTIVELGNAGKIQEILSVILSSLSSVAALGFWFGTSELVSWIPIVGGLLALMLAFVIPMALNYVGFLLSKKVSIK